VNHGGAEAPQGGVLQGLLPAPQQRRWGPARRGGGKGALVVLDSVGTASAVGTVGARGLGSWRAAQAVRLWRLMSAAGRGPTKAIFWKAKF